MPDFMLRTHSLSFKYPGASLFTFPDLQCIAGENLLVLGESGTGKTTLLHLLAGILTPASGTINYHTHTFSTFNSSQRDHFRGAFLGMIFQKHFFIEGLSVFENLLAAQKLVGAIPDKAYLLQLIEKLDIQALAHQKAYKLSQGEQQRFSIARALANKPAWVLADEPTSSLDDRNCNNFAGLMQMDLTGNPLSWIVATHDQRLRDYFNQTCQL